MKRHHLFGFPGALAAVALTCALALRGADSPPPPATPPPADQPAAAPAPAAEPAKPETPPPAAPAAATTAAPAAPVAEPAEPAKPPETAPAESTQLPEAAPAPSGELRRIDTEVAPAPGDSDRESRRAGRGLAHRHIVRSYTGNEKVTFGYGSHVAKDEKVDAAVSIFGSTVVDGEVSDAAVSVMGSTTVNGSAGNAAVSVLGDTTVNGSVGEAAVAVGGDLTINGEVGGQAVAVGGRIILGPKAVVRGEVVAVGGALEKDPAAVIKGNVQNIRLPAISWLFAWARSALFKGRLLSFAHGAGWAWLVAAAFLAFYMLLALIFRRGIEKCAETLEQRPGMTVVAALLTTMAMPLIFLLLAITGVGVLVIPFLALGLFFGKLFGRAAMLAWFGRRFTGFLGGGIYSHAVTAVFLGGLFVMALYLVPVLAFIVSVLIGWLGLGMVVYSLILSMRRNGTKPARAVAAAAPVAAVPPVGAAVAFAAGAGESVAGAVVPPLVAAPPVAPVVTADTLPRAGFWIRLAASLLDFILILVVALMIHIGSVFLLLFAAYCVVLWALRGTTIGGIICGLKVVRLDDRTVDWSVAIVRALAACLSLAVVGLGFIWVAFDDQRQSWHDKIAGTTIVKVPKSISLV
ncbi:MAG TPA: RDD family protein [Opitutaceae bacterium]|nr:RDD family protein [Opitutaceae bacterium]